MIIKTILLTVPFTHLCTLSIYTKETHEVDLCRCIQHFVLLLAFVLSLEKIRVQDIDFKTTRYQLRH